MQTWCVWLLIIELILSGGQIVFAGSSKNATTPNNVTTSMPATLSVDVVSTHDNDERKKLYMQVRKLFAERRFDDLDRLAEHLQKTKEMSSRGNWKLVWFYGALDELSDDGADRARGIRFNWTHFLNVLQQWVNEKPSSVTARVVLANSLVSYAWEARGGGVARTVGKQDRQLFEERLAQADKVLKDAHKLNANCPELFRSWQRVALGQGWDKQSYDKLVKEALAKEPEYYPLYFGKCFYLQPRWYGQDDDMAQFAEQSANKLGGTEGDKLYARIVWDMHSNELYDNVINELGFSWPRIKRGFDVLAKEYSNDIGVISEYCYLATVADDKATAKELFAKLGNIVAIPIWKKKRNYFQARKLIAAS